MAFFLREDLSLRRKEDDRLMKEFFLKYLASTRLMTILFFVFPAAMGLGTFIETWYSTDTAKIWIYNAWWFELIMGLFVLNFIGNIFATVYCERRNGQY